MSGHRLAPARTRALVALVALGALAAPAVAAAPERSVAVGGGAPAAAVLAVADRPWLDTSLPLERRVSSLLRELTLDEAARLLYGVRPPDEGSVGYVPGVPRLDVPPLVASDGPAGLRDSGRTPVKRPATGLPAPLAVAASFDPGLARSLGVLLGREARARGVHVLYAPAVNLTRVPVGGRNFEYLGEDPLLASRLTVPYVRGVQSVEVAAQLKHFVLNEQENGRTSTSSNVDDRTMRELYLPAFEAGVKTGGAWSVMCAYNAVNGVFACENRSLLTGLLREEWGFDGMVSSDYGATRAAIPSIRAGLDQTFTITDWGRHYRDLPALVRSGEIPRSLVTEAARRVLRLMFRVGLLDPARPAPPVDVAAHAALSRTAAQEGTVLLRNDAGLLPLQPAGLTKVAVLGPYASTAHPGGSGSSRVTPYRTVSPVQGLQARLGPGVQVVGDDGADRVRAAELAAGADVAVVVVGDLAGEGVDRPSMDLPAGQDELVEAVAAANPDTVVVLQTGGPVTMPWLPRTPTLLETWYPGQEGGAALAAVLLGDVDPSGRLPMTFPRSLAQSPSTGTPRYPAGPGGYTYSERLHVGYRGFDALGRTPLFPFGYGLSYAGSELSNVRVASPTSGGAQVSFTVRNTGTRAATAVPQVYLGFPAGAGEPPRVLAGFQRLPLEAGASKRVTVALPLRTLQVWDPAASAWEVPAGRFTAFVGTSSRDLPLSTTFDPAP